MDTKKKIFFMSALALLACSCQEDKITDPTGTAAPGVEVNFGGMLGDGETRTIYGSEADGGFPIYWVDGDQVLIASPDCAESGVPSATYAVSVDGPQQNYATSMDKTGEIGVRWGDNLTGAFYSIFPVVANEAGTETNKFNSDYKSARVMVTTQQNCLWNTTNNTVSPDMRACIMYAKTENVNAGEAVNLAYKPLSTAVRFLVNGPTTGDPITISYIRLWAPTGVSLSGTFDVDFTQTDASGMPVVKAVNGVNYASMNAANRPGTGGTYLTLAAGEKAEVQLFFLLENEVTMDENWRIVVATSDGRLFTKNITATAGGNTTLKPGQIHKLPGLPSLSQPEAWDPSNWMANIQRNVYLSEISIPGSWNSLNPDYQGENPNLTAQYNAGVRAFHLDTRWRATNDWYGIIGSAPITDLGIATGGSTYDVGGGKCATQSAPRFVDALNEVTSRVQPDEYMVVYCTFAQGSYAYEDWRKEIADACANNDAVIDASKLNANSTVADVLGKVIVIVSTYTEGAVQSKMFFTDLRNALDQEEFQRESYFKKDLTLNNETLSDIDLYATYATITDDNNGEDMGDRGYGPSLDERQTKCENLFNWSQNNYSEGEFNHNAWMFTGLGGYVFEHKSWDIAGTLDNENYTAVNNKLVAWLNGRLRDMEVNDAYYPVGIVFMNDALNHRSGNDVDVSTTIEDILLLNNRYRKAYDPNRSPADGEYIEGEGTKSIAPGYSSGMVDNRTDAIKW